MTGRRGMYLAAGLFVLTLVYGIFQARTLINGPSLTVVHPRPGELVAGVMMDVHGETSNVTQLSINGRPVTMTLEGAFSEPLVTPDGYGVILVLGTDRFGRSVEERIEFVGAPGTTIDDVPLTATTTS